MALWKFKMADVESEISVGGDYINRSGCYVFVVEKAEVFTAADSLSTAINFIGKTTEEENARINLWFKDKEGNDIEFNTKHLNQLCYLLQTNPDKLNIVTRKEGKEEKEYIDNFEKIKIGMFIEYIPPKDDKKYGDYRIKGFFDPVTKKTANEVLNNSESKKYKEFEDKFFKQNQEQPIYQERKSETRKPTKTHPDNEKYFVSKEDIPNDDEFPF